MSYTDSEDFEARKRQSFLQVLFKTARLANELAIERAREVIGDERLRTAHTALFPHIDDEGIRLTALAEQVGVTKQAVQKLVDEMEDFGVVERVPDPRDGRAKLIRWTDAGRANLDVGLGVLAELDDQFGELVGREELRRTHGTLLQILDELEQR